MSVEDPPKLQIIGAFSKADLKLGDLRSGSRGGGGYTHATYEIQPHKGFEYVELPYDGQKGTLAYNHIYDVEVNHFEIELNQCAIWEANVKKARGNSKLANLKRLKFHYKKAISLLSPYHAAGWNRWSDNILDLFISGKLHRVLLGSGNCGKSQTYAILLYIKWRIRPHKRMIIIASRVMTEAKERVIGYIKEIHTSAPPSHENTFFLSDGKGDQGIYCEMEDKNTGKFVKNDRGCIRALPIKIQGKSRELGANLKGKHPDDQLIIAFDEGQELPGDIIDMDIFANWYTNPNIEVHAWGNPQPIDFYDKESHDLLYRLALGKDSEETLKQRLLDAERTGTWTNKNTTVLHLSMLDSPKDDLEETNNFRLDGMGNQILRLNFLAGKANAKLIAENTTPNSPSWYSQVLGFPFINFKGSGDKAVLSASMVQACRDYPLRWLNEEINQWFLSCDPALGDGDDCSIVCGSKGLMRDGRQGIDLHNGKFCVKVQKVENEEFVDTVINKMFKYSTLLKIPLDRISIETHGTGEVFRYALQKHIEQGKWKRDFDRGMRYIIQNPTRGVTTRQLFRSLGHMEPAKDIVASYATELSWAVRCGVLSRQIFNVPDFILQQFYTRYLEKTASGTKYKLETKEEMKSRGLKSPNDADAMCGLLDLMRLKGFKYQFANRYEYKDRYGNDYMSWRERKEVGKAFGIVSRALQIGVNLGGYDEEDRSNRDGKLPKGRGLFNIPAV